MKKVILKYFLFVTLLLTVISPFLSQISSQNALAQTASGVVDVYTNGYSVLGPNAFVFHGSFDRDDVKDKEFTTYFEFRKDNSGTKYDSDDLLKYFNLVKDKQETIKIERGAKKNKVLKFLENEDGSFDISAELNLFATYYFRAVGYFNDNPDKKFYGGTFSIDTGYIPPGWSVPFTIEGGNYVVRQFEPTSITTSVFVTDVARTNATIKSIVYNKNPENLNLKIAYGEDNYTFETDFIFVERSGNFVVELKDLKPNTRYYFVLYDTENKLTPSNELSFDTLANVVAEEPTEISANAFFLQTTDTTAEIKTVVSNKNPDQLKLIVEYGKNDFDTKSELVKIDARGSVSVTLKNLTPETGYYFRLFDTTGKLEPSSDGRFFTNKKGVISELRKQIITSVYDLSPTSVLVRANIYNADVLGMELRVWYGEGRLLMDYDPTQDAYYYVNSFPQRSSVMTVDKSGNASVVLNDLKSGTEYHYMVVNEKDDPETAVLERAFPDESKVFKTLNADGTASPVEEDTPAEEEAGTGWVECTTNCGFEEFMNLIDKMMRVILFDLSIPFTAIMFAYAGFEVLTAGPDTEKRKKAIGIATNVGIGLVLVAAAFLIIQTILSTLGYDGSLFGF